MPEKLRPKWCECKIENESIGKYIERTVFKPDHECSCKVVKNHTHCIKCGGIIRP